MEYMIKMPLERMICTHGSIFSKLLSRGNYFLECGNNE